MSMIVVEHTPQSWAQMLRQNFAFAVNRIKKDGMLPSDLGLDTEVESALIQWMIKGDMDTYKLAERALAEQIAGQHDGA